MSEEFQGRQVGALALVSMTDWHESVINSRAVGWGQNEILGAVGVVGGWGIVCGGDGVWAGGCGCAQVSGD